jgi:hypothetical protein
MLLPLGTALAEGTLRTLARRQGSTVDTSSGEAPGKIMHELRRADARVQRASDAGPVTYYGTIDATLLWISLLADARRWGMADVVVADLLPNLRRALSWLERYGDPDGDGFLEYIDATGRGLANQGWKDSFNAIRFHDGSIGRARRSRCARFMGTRTGPPSTRPSCSTRPERGRPRGRASRAAAACARRGRRDRPAGGRPTGRRHARPGRQPPGIRPARPDPVGAC